MKTEILPGPGLEALRPLVPENGADTLKIMGLPLEAYRGAALKESGLEPEAGRLCIEANLLFQTDLKPLAALHREKGAELTLLLRPCPKDDPRRAVCLEGDGRITGLREPGTWSADPTPLEPAGVCLLAKEAPETGRDCIQLLRRVLHRGGRVYGLALEGYARSICTPADYLAAHQDILKGAYPGPLRAQEVREGFWVESGARLEKGALIEPPAYLSQGSVVERGARVGAGTFLGPGAALRTGSAAVRAVVGPNCELESQAEVRGGILAREVRMGRGSRVLEETVVGERCVLEPECQIGAGLRIWPQKRIQKGVRIRENLVWGSLEGGRLFCGQGICGEVNVDITPEFMAKLGAAAGTLFRDGKIGLSWEGAPVCEMLASALAAGLISAGIQVYRFGEQSLPVARSGTAYYRLQGGIHIDQRRIQDTVYPELTFLNAGGGDFTQAEEEALERVFGENLFRRAEPQRIRPALGLENYRLYYIQEILNSLRATRFRRNMELRTRSETVSETLEILLAELEKQMRQPPGPAEFQGEISENGQELTLFTSGGTPLERQQLLAWYTLLLCQHFQVREIVLPVTASTQVERLAARHGGRIIRCGASNGSWMQSILERGSRIQLRLCFDGVFAAVSILDYLNLRELSFDQVVKELPAVARREEELPVEAERLGDLIQQLYQKYKDRPTDLTDGLKIYQDNGWTLILPDRSRRSIRVITEGTDMEAAAELSKNFKKEIKTLANSK